MIEQAFNSYVIYILTHIVKDVENFNHLWMLLIVPAIIWFIIIIFKYFLLLIPIWFPFYILFNLIKNLLKKPEYSKKDVEFAFEKGIHEGRLREHYKGNDDGTFSPSELDFYLNNYDGNSNK